VTLAWHECLGVQEGTSHIRLFFIDLWCASSELFPEQRSRVYAWPIVSFVT
jgi:hypothetical protein